MLPLLVERDAQGQVAALFGHLARSNPQFALLETPTRGDDPGPGARGLYLARARLDPDLGSDLELRGRAVRGRCALRAGRTHDALERLAAWLKRDRPNPWTLDCMGTRYAGMAQHIIAFRATVREVHPAFKLGQDERRETFAEIVARIDPALGDWMTRTVPD